jgi:hypothetical protein
MLPNDYLNYEKAGKGESDYLANSFDSLFVRSWNNVCDYDNSFRGLA